MTQAHIFINAFSGSFSAPLRFRLYVWFFLCIKNPITSLLELTLLHLTVFTVITSHVSCRSRIKFYNVINSTETINSLAVMFHGRRQREMWAPLVEDKHLHILMLKSRWNVVKLRQAGKTAAMIKKEIDECQWTSICIGKGGGLWKIPNHAPLPFQ